MADSKFRSMLFERIDASRFARSYAYFADWSVRRKRHRPWRWCLQGQKALRYKR